MLQWNPDFFFQSPLYTENKSVFPDLWGMDAPRFLFSFLSLSTIHFMANATSRPQGKISCLFQYWWIVSLYILLFYNSHTRFPHQNKNWRSTLFLPPLASPSIVIARSMFCYWLIATSSNPPVNASVGMHGCFLCSSRKIEIKIQHNTPSTVH